MYVANTHYKKNVTKFLCSGSIEVYGNKGKQRIIHNKLYYFCTLVYICPSIIEHTRNHSIPSGWVQRQGLLLQQSGGMSGLSVQPSQLHFSTMVSSVSSSSAVYKMKENILYPKDHQILLYSCQILAIQYIQNTHQSLSLKNGQFVRRGWGRGSLAYSSVHFLRQKNISRNTET
jgi:hypothetical protein